MYAFDEHAGMCLLICVRHVFPHLGGCYGNYFTSARKTPSLKRISADRDAEKHRPVTLPDQTRVSLITKEAAVHQSRLRRHK